MLGDPAYPLLRWMMKPFPDCDRLTQEQRNFNYRLSKARVVVENAYGRLKGRWRVLMKKIDVRLEDVSDIVAACCVLHNICEAHGETFDDELLDNSFRSTCNSHVESHPKLQSVYRPLEVLEARQTISEHTSFTIKHTEDFEMPKRWLMVR